MTLKPAMTGIAAEETPPGMAAQPMPATPARSRIEDEVLRLQALAKSGRFDEVLEGAERLLEEVPENRDVCT